MTPAPDEHDLAALVKCLEREPRSHVLDWVGIAAPPEIVPPRRVKQVRTGRWGRVLIRSHTAVKIQKVVCRHGKLLQVEWRDGPERTKVALDAFQELIAAQLFGILDIGPTVKHVLLARHLPAWVEDDGVVNDKCWYLIVVMQRMRGTMRDVKHMPSAQRAALWAGTDPARLAELVTGLADLNIDHGDLRLDNVMYTVGRSGTVKPCLADWGYCKVKPAVGFRQLSKEMGDKLTGVLRDAGAPASLCSEVRRRIRGARRPATLTP